MDIKNIIYVFACLSFAVIIGGAIYEHLAVVPRWRAAPPASLSMFQGQYGLNAAAFWTKIHPVTLLLFAVTLVLFWKTGCRQNLLITAIGYVVVLITTFVYFVPELLDITGTAYSDTVDSLLAKRARMWEILSLVRLLFLIVLSVNLFLGLTKVAGTSTVSHIAT